MMEVAVALTVPVFVMFVWVVVGIRIFMTAAIAVKFIWAINDD